MKRLSIILGIIIALITITGAVYRFDVCKASKESVAQLSNNFEIYKMEQYRRYIQERIWALQARFPDYANHPEYRRLITELMQIDQKIKAYYERKAN